MVSKNATTPTCEELSGERSDIADMRADIDDLQRQNQTLEDNVHLLQGVDMVEKLEALDPLASIGRDMEGAHP